MICLALRGSWETCRVARTHWWWLSILQLPVAHLYVPWLEPQSVPEPVLTLHRAETWTWVKSQKYPFSLQYELPLAVSISVFLSRLCFPQGKGAWVPKVLIRAFPHAWSSVCLSRWKIKASAGNSSVSKSLSVHSCRGHTGFPALACGSLCLLGVINDGPRPCLGAYPKSIDEAREELSLVGTMKVLGIFFRIP